MQRHQPARQIVRFWWSDASLTALLVFLLLVLFVIYPLQALGVFGTFLLEVFFSLIVVSGVVSVSTHKVTAVIATALAVTTLSLHWGRFAAASTGPLAVMDAAASLAMLGMLAGVVLTQAFRDGPITVHRIVGAVAAYILIGLMFSLAYKLISLTVPNAFITPQVTGEHDLVANELAYFSFVTLTTVGYGDVTAVYPLARSLAVLEALIGQLFPAILIARLVSLEIHYRQLRHRDDQNQKPL